jgi:hypothetical protein
MGFLKFQILTGKSSIRHSKAFVFFISALDVLGLEFGNKRFISRKKFV